MRFRTLGSENGDSRMIITNIRDKESIIDLIPSLLIIEEECFSHPWHEESFVELMNNKDALLLAAIDKDDKVAGYISLLNVVGEGQILNVAVREAYRRRGIAQTLVSEAMRQASAGFSDTEFTLEVRKSNMGARALYEKLGFICEGIRPGYYSDPVEDACIYWNRNYGN